MLTDPRSDRVPTQRAGSQPPDDYLVLVIDPQSAEVDAHGPLDAVAAGHKAVALRADLDRSPELGDVEVLIVALQRPTGGP